MTRTLILALALCGVMVGAQTLTSSLSPTTASPGGTSTYTLTFTDATPSANIAGLQFQLTLPAGLTNGSAALGAASTGAGKVLSCAATPFLCIVVGSGTPLNATPFGTGVILTLPLTVASTSALGPMAVTMLNTAGSDNLGNFIGMSIPPATLTISSIYDLNSDGVINAADVQLAIAMFESGKCTGPFAQVGDGKCQVNDVVKEILAALGLIH